MNKRRSIRLKEYDYSKPGAYFVTVCTQNRECLFGNIDVGAGPRACPGMQLNEYGKIVERCWDNLPNHYQNIELDYFIIMPNHFHGIINIIDVGAGSSRPCNNKTNIDNDNGRENRAPTLGQIIAYFKYNTTKKLNESKNSKIEKIWQRNYYEHIIRDENDLNEIREYIVNNPAKWPEDRNNPLNINNDVGARHASPLQLP